MTSATATHTPGRFVWHDLITPDLEGAQRFYGALAGWTFKSQAMGPGQPPYAMAYAGDRPIAGLTQAGVGSGMPPIWLGYVSVPDVDAAADAARTAGGRVALGPAEMPGVGRFALLEDPQGGALMAYKSANGDAEAPELPPVGTFCWDQLNTTAPDAAAGFYARVFGWEAAPFPGAEGMRVFSTGETQAGSMVHMPVNAPAHWLTYLHVADLAAARAQVTGLGAEVLVEDVEVATIGRIAVIRDPQGVVVCLFQPVYA